MDITKTCPICGKEFTYNKSYAGAVRKYCSYSCARLANAKNGYRRNPERLSNYSHKGYLSQTIIHRYNGRCAICGWRATEELITAKGRKQYAYGNEVHHIIAVEDGGEATEDNLILLCPNHHKQADLGLLTIEELQSYLKEPPTEEEKQAMRNRATDTVTRAIFEG